MNQKTFLSYSTLNEPIPQFFKQEPCASSDRFSRPCLPIILISSHIPNNVTNYTNLGKQEPTIDFGNVNNQLTLKMLNISRI